MAKEHPQCDTKSCLHTGRDASSHFPFRWLSFLNMSAILPEKHSGARRGHICLSNISLTSHNRNLLSRITVSPKTCAGSLLCASVATHRRLQRKNTQRCFSFDTTRTRPPQHPHADPPRVSNIKWAKTCGWTRGEERVRGCNEKLEVMPMRCRCRFKCRWEKHTAGSQQI